MAPRKPGHGLRQIVCLAASTVALWGAVACTSNTDGPTSGGTTTPAATATSESPKDAAGRLAVEAYKGMLSDFAEAAQTSNWKSPGLARHATGDALSVITRSLFADELAGLVSKGAPISTPVVTTAEPALEPTKVTITDCNDSSNWLKYKRTGELANDTPGGRRLITAVAVRQPDGAWKVDKLVVQALRTC